MVAGNEEIPLQEYRYDNNDADEDVDEDDQFTTVEHFSVPCHRKETRVSECILFSDFKFHQLSMILHTSNN